MGDPIGDLAAFGLVKVVIVQAEAVGPGVGGTGAGRSAIVGEHAKGGIGQNDAKDDEKDAVIDDPGNEGAGESAGRGADLEPHGDAQVGHVLFYIGRGRAAAGGDHADDAGADGITDIDAQEEG